MDDFPDFPEIHTVNTWQVFVGDFSEPVCVLIDEEAEASLRRGDHFIWNSLLTIIEAIRPDRS